MLVTNITEFSSLPLRCSTSCSHVLKMQFPLACWRFWQIMEIYSFDISPFFSDAFSFSPPPLFSSASALLYQEHLLLGSWSRDGMINDALWAQLSAWLEWLAVSWISAASIPVRRRVLLSLPVDSYSWITSTKSPSFCMKTFSASLKPYGSSTSVNEIAPAM
jgi:hypothetical protein